MTKPIFATAPQAVIGFLDTVTGQFLQYDAVNPLPTTGGGGGGGNAAAGATGAAVPADAGYTGFSVGGTLTGVSAANPLPVTSSPAGVSPAAASATAVATGGTAVTAFSGPTLGGIIQNPLSATDQGISTAEPLYVNIVSSAGTLGNGSNFVLQPGASFPVPPLATGKNVSVNAASSSHSFSATKW